MFNFKKRVSKVAAQVKHSFEPTRDPKEVVAEIHAAFDNSTHELLTAANKVLADEKDISKGDRLQKLGFSCSVSAKEAVSDIQNKKFNKGLADHIAYYQTWYPNYKFITEWAIATICKKYSLVFGNAFWYKGDVPEKNIAEIENFKLRDEDSFTYKLIDDEYTNERGEVIKHKGYYKPDVYSRSSFVNLTGKDCTNLKDIEPFKICAPIKDFDEHYIKNYCRVEDGYKLVALPDPIVLQPVQGGYLIITKWGLEASDENVVNEKMN